jgi:hypothetical protein
MWVLGHSFSTFPLLPFCLHRHHWGMASCAAVGAFRLTISSREEWRSPLGEDNLWLSQTQVPPARKENANGQVYPRRSARPSAAGPSCCDGSSRWTRYDVPAAAPRCASSPASPSPRRSIVSWNTCDAARQLAHANGHLREGGSRRLAPPPPRTTPTRRPLDLLPFPRQVLCEAPYSGRLDCSHLR